MKKFLFVLFILASFAFAAFDPTQYLYGGELPSSIRYENFSRGGTEYSLVVISGQPAFFLANGSLVNDTTLTEQVVTQYYREQYYLSDAEITEVRSLIESFNASRNDGRRFKGREEYACRDALFLPGIRYGEELVNCDTEEGCIKLSQIIYSAPFAEGIRRTLSFEQFVSEMDSLSDATFGNDDLVTRDLELVSNLTPANVRPSLEEIRSSIPDLRENSATVEGTVFRDYRDQEDFNRCLAENCLQLCPDLDMNETYLDQLDTRIGVYLDRLQTVGSFDTAAQDLLNNTRTRIQFKEDTEEADQLTQIFAPVENRALQVINQSRTTESLIRNSQFSSQVNRLATLVTSINQSIRGRNFSTVLTDIESADALTQDVAQQSTDLMLVYNTALAAKGDADAALFLLEIREISDESEPRFVEVRNQIATLDAQFRPGFSDTEYFSYTEKYRNVSNQANQLLEEERSKPITATVSKIRAFARRVNHGINDFLTIAGLEDVPTTTDHRMLFGSVALINFVAFTSLTVVLFVIAYRAFRPNKIFISAVFAVLSAALLVFSGLLFVYGEKTANNADLEEFLDEIARENVTAVFVDVRGSDNPDVMVACAERVADALRARNISTGVYQISANGCSQDGIAIPAGQCTSIAADTTSFMMNYSNTYQKPTFKTVFQPHAYISGNTLNYRLCPLGLVLE